MKEDVYVLMLRFGKEKLDDGFKIEDLVDYLKKKGIADMSVNSTLLHQYFFRVFFSRNVNDSYPPADNEKFYLRPECYMQLLEYENMLETRREAKKARTYAIIAIVLTLLSIIVSVIQQAL